ncbi:HGxxPAAW family protein [Lapillicoccus sp.]|uniref:HGxxPAAW family protein n=1 Tax=Lapillicoccus sp. TaxID=1909287 RepID=UPI0027C151B0|nr:hypothetical protein [Actinomycetota bacterium]
MTESAGVDHEMHEDHGHSTAAWTAVAFIMAGSLVMSIAVVFPSVLGFVIGAVVVVIGIILGKVLSMAGYGSTAGTREASHRTGTASADLPGRNQHDSGTS